MKESGSQDRSTGTTTIETSFSFRCASISPSLVNLSTLIEVSITFKDDIDAAADYVVHFVLPNIIPDVNTANTSGDSYSQGHQPVSDDTESHLEHAPTDSNTNSEPLQSEGANIYLFENEDSSMGELMQSPAAASTSGQACLHEENNSDSLLADTQNPLVDDEVIYLGNQQNVTGMSTEDDLTLHDNVSSDMTMRSTYPVSLESLDNAIAYESYSKNTLVSNVAAISEMLYVVELNEAKAKDAVSEASQAGIDILVEVGKLKEMSTLAAEENSKVAGEVSAEKSILSTEAQGLEARLFNISEERNNYVLIIDEMHHSLQRRLAVSEAEREAAETEKIERETMAWEMLKEQELLLEAAKEESKKLENQVQENAKLRELLMDRGHVVDALHGEMLGIFESITQLQYRVDTRLRSDESFYCGGEVQRVSSSLSSSAKQADSEPPVDEPWQLASSSLSSSVKQAESNLLVDEPTQLVSSSFSSSVKSEALKLPVGEPRQLDSSNLYCSVISASSESSCSAYQSKSNLNGDESIANASSHDYFALDDDSWDIVEDEATKAYAD